MYALQLNPEYDGLFSGLLQPPVSHILTPIGNVFLLAK